ncbi:hypothetical protein HDU92_001217 [Lobulomyces angularis]|nr:hypothetical protein HDU92_001217 [Lobulomyces angularis]
MPTCSKNINDYIVRVRAGPGYDCSSLQTVNVNNEHSPVLIEGEYFTGFLSVRLKNFSGVVSEKFKNQNPIANPDSTYFEGKNRRYSITVQGRFSKEINCDDIIFGINLDSPVKSPPGTNLAIKFGKWLDPGLFVETEGDNPYIMSPLFCSMNTIGIFKADSFEVNDTEIQSGKLISKSPSHTIKDDKINALPKTNIGKWSFHSRLVPENVSLLINESQVLNTKSDDESGTKFSLTSNYLTKKKVVSDINIKKNFETFEKRKKFFTDVNNRKKFNISTDHIYCMEYYDAYFDINTISLKLPGVTLNGFRYWEGQPLRYVARSRSDPSIVFFTCWFELIEKSTLLEEEKSLKKDNDKANGEKEKKNNVDSEEEFFDAEE